MIAGSGDNAHEEGVPVKTTNSPPTHKTWEVTVDCLIQRNKGRIDGYSIVEIPHMSEMKDGDTIKLSGKTVCHEYDIGSEKSVTSAVMILSGENIDPRAQPGELKYLLVGRAS
jgi:hypothetical protein